MRPEICNSWGGAWNVKFTDEQKESMKRMAELRNQLNVVIYKPENLGITRPELVAVLADMAASWARRQIKSEGEAAK